MVVAFPGGVPLAHVLPVMMAALPLREDYEEALPVLACLAYLHHHAPASVGEGEAETGRDRD